MKRYMRQHRKAKIRAEHWRNDDSRCCWCFREMWFHKHESKADAKRRLCLETTGELRKRRATIEHLKPLAHGGGNERSNIRLACHGCNSKRGAPVTPERLYMEQSK